MEAPPACHAGAWRAAPCGRRGSCYLAEGIEETTALVAAERARNLMVYYFIVVHQKAEPGREEDVPVTRTDQQIS